MSAARLVTSELTDHEWNDLLSVEFPRATRRCLELIRNLGNKPTSKLFLEESVSTAGNHCILDLSETNQIWRDYGKLYRLAIVNRKAFRKSEIQIFRVETIPSRTLGPRRSSNVLGTLKRPSLRLGVGVPFEYLLADIETLDAKVIELFSTKLQATRKKHRPPYVEVVDWTFYRRPPPYADIGSGEIWFVVKYVPITAT
jgi:hypothetical protein